eukprot:scaffold383_cov272-Pinguiococcus_pyrenoidosus.AAC.3
MEIHKNLNLIWRTKEVCVWPSRQNWRGRGAVVHENRTEDTAAFSARSLLVRRSAQRTQASTGTAAWSASHPPPRAQTGTRQSSRRVAAEDREAARAGASIVDTRTSGKSEGAERRKGVGKGRVCSPSGARTLNARKIFEGMELIPPPPPGDAPPSLEPRRPEPFPEAEVRFRRGRTRRGWQ